MTSQLQILNKILQNKDYSLISLNNLSEEYFFNYKAEYKYIKNHYETYGTVPDNLTFLNNFPSFDIVEVSEPNSFLMEQLVKDYNTSYLATRFNDIKKLLESGKTDKAVDYFMRSVDNLHIGSTLQSTDLIQDHSRYDRFIEKTADMSIFYISTGFKELDDLIGGLDRKNENMVIAARTGIGKCLAKGTEVLMANGTIKKVEDIIIGDKVQSLNRINTVQGFHNGISNGYKIIPSKGDSFIVSANHILTVYEQEEVYDKQRHIMTTNGKGKLIDIMIEDYLALSAHKRRNMRLIRPAIDYQAKTLYIDPYIFGTWLGDGTSRDDNIYTAEYENKLNKLGVISNKHIPLEYLTGSRQQRLELLAGLLDTDGHYNNYTKNGKTINMFDFCQKNNRLFTEFLQLCRGLGFRVCVQKPKIIKGIEYNRATISGNLIDIPTRVPRKRAKPSTSINNPLLFGFKVEPVDRVEYYGFMCDGDHRYMLADNTLTHNTWTLIKMAVAASQQGLITGIYSGEMTTDKVGYRVDTLLGHIDNKAITRGKGYIAKQYKEYMNSLATSGYGPIKVLTPADINGPATVDALRAFIEKEHLDILFIDQYSLLEDSSHAKAQWERIGNISKAIKNLQVIKQIPIVSVSQMNRTKNEDESLDTTQIGLADRIGQDATVVLMLSRNEERLIVNVVKARDGGDDKKLTYHADFNTGCFEFLNEEASDEEATKIKESYEVNRDNENLF